MVEAYSKIRGVAGLNSGSVPAAGSMRQMFGNSLNAFAGQLKKAPDADETRNNTALFNGVSALAQKHALKLNNKTGTKIDPARLVFVLGGAEEWEDRRWQNYKFGRAEVGARKSGDPVSVTVPPGTSYQALNAFMSEVRAAYLKKDRFKSIYIDSHGYIDGWIGTFANELGQAKYLAEYNLFSSMKPFRTAEQAPFYEHTEYLRLTGCQIFGNLNVAEVAYLQSLARDHDVRIEANTTDGWINWGRDEQGGFFTNTGNEKRSGPGGNAYAFLPDGRIVKIKRPHDRSSYEATDLSNINTLGLEKAWKASGGLVENEARAPYQISFGPITLTYRK